MPKKKKRVISVIDVSCSNSDVVGKPPLDVNFYDYDGTIVESYTKSEFAQLTQMPKNSIHTGLTAQGWNWSFEDAQEYVEKYGKLNIGQMYITTDGRTRIYVELSDGTLSQTLAIKLNGTCTIDWGDNSTDTITGTSLNEVASKKHTYANVGSYVIALQIDGQARIIWFIANSKVDYTIIVPDDLYDEWIAVEYWSAYIDYIVKASEYEK